MALRARLVAPPPPPKEIWPWHEVKYAGLSSSALLNGDRRMEAETYLSSGFGIARAIESKPGGWARFGNLANVWMPGRLKGIQVSREFGTPFLAATQVFDIRPVPRKWLALERTEDASSRFVTSGMILVTCSGSVGRATLAGTPHERTLISHDLLRVEAVNQRDQGWLYAYLHAPQVRAMAIGAQYGHIIKHLETSHLDALPIPTVDEEVASTFTQRVSQILDLRNEAYRLTLEAEAVFEKALGPAKITDWGETGFSIKASNAFLSGRRRLDASMHNPGVAAILRHLAKHGEGFTAIGRAGYDVWVPGRYKRIPAEDGVVYRDSADLLEVSPDLVKRFADCPFGDEFRGRVKSGWILMPCSGQVYGIIGTAILATEALNDQVVSNHVVRVAPRKGSAPTGYVVTALSHPVFGRPVVKALAFGSSIPEIDPDDLSNFQIVRLGTAKEFAIADLAQGSAKARAAADLLELEISKDAATIIDRFIAHS
jgi:type I restriction enzyme S subunit